jgi:hypothetical protein
MVKEIINKEDKGEGIRSMFDLEKTCLFPDL